MGYCYLNAHHLCVTNVIGCDTLGITISYDLGFTDTSLCLLVDYSARGQNSLPCPLSRVSNINVPRLNPRMMVLR